MFRTLFAGLLVAYALTGIVLIGSNHGTSRTIPVPAATSCSTATTSLLGSGCAVDYAAGNSTSYTWINWYQPKFIGTAYYLPVDLGITVLAAILIMVLPRKSRNNQLKKPDQV